MNLHVALQKPMTKTAVLSLCRLIELLKASCANNPILMLYSCVLAFVLALACVMSWHMMCDVHLLLFIVITIDNFKFQFQIPFFIMTHNYCFPFVNRLLTTPFIGRACS